VKLSTKARYGTRALLDIALNSEGKPVPLRDISARQQIPLPYLEQLVAPLIRGGLVGSSRGVKGGVWLNKPPGEIRMSEVTGLLVGSLMPVRCVTNPEECSRSGYCVTRDVWEELVGAMDSVLEATTLQDLVERQKQKQPPGC
jgi:Rrf2 family protein